MMEYTLVDPSNSDAGKGYIVLKGEVNIFLQRMKSKIDYCYSYISQIDKEIQKIYIIYEYCSCYFVYLF